MDGMLYTETNIQAGVKSGQWRQVESWDLTEMQAQI